MNRDLLIPRRAAAPAGACLRCHFEDCLGTCNTVPADLDDVPPRPAEAVSEFCAPDDKPRRSLLQRLVNLCRRWLLGYKIRSAEKYLRLCAAEGIATGRTIFAWREQIEEMRDQLHALEAAR